MHVLSLDILIVGPAQWMSHFPGFAHLVQVDTCCIDPLQRSTLDINRIRCGYIRELLLNADAWIWDLLAWIFSYRTS